nr:dienelactone hydrolase [Thermaceae bacterium]
PYAWSVDLCQRLTALGKHPECYSYPGAHHTFSGQADALFMQRVRDFFKRTLK